MSNELPQPHHGAQALRAHLKALERGVAEARTQRLGVAAPPRTAGSVGPSGAMAGVIGAAPAVRAPGAAYGTMSAPKPAAPSPPSAASSGKPRAARAKSAGDFGAFFDSIQKRDGA
jgi:hypothetical protein